MMLRVFGGLPKAFDDGCRRRQIRIADAEIDDIDSLAIAACFILSMAANR